MIAPITSPLLQVCDLSVSFDSGTSNLQVTDKVSFDIFPAETLALVGESGSGKSVTAMSILNLLPHNARTSGSIKYKGGELLGLAERQLDKIRSQDIAVIFQDPMTALNPVYTIGQLMADALRSRKLSKAELRRRSLELLDHVGIPEPQRKIDQYPHQFSGGQRQRAMIAMAIASNPGLLIADEPTTALDVTVQAEILDLLIALQRENDMGILLITHDMGVVADVADRVNVMRHGRILEAADTLPIFEAPKHDYTRELLAAVPKLGTVSHPRHGSEELPAHRTPSLSFKDVVVEFPTKLRRPAFRAVDTVSFDVFPGEVVGLVGESGSGKSTLGRVAVGLQAIAAGHAKICGTDLLTASRNDIRKVRREAAIVFQDPASSLDPRMTIGQSVAAPLKWNGLVTKREALAKRAHELLDMVRIPSEWASRYPHELSGGQRQRVGIARALSLQPKVMVADEPTSALDVSVQAAVLDLLRELQASLGFSCLFISHDLAVVEMLSDRVVVLRSGQIVEQGTTGTVLAEPTDDYTRKLVAAAPVPDPRLQARRREQRLLAHSA